MPAVLLRGLLRWWNAIGWFGVVLLIYLSLTPRPPSIDMTHGDKFGHLLAYATVMFWWAQRWVSLRARCGLAVSFIALGIAIEYVQGWTGWRAFEYFDMVADAVGVLLGWALAWCVPNVVAWLARRVESTCQA